MRHGDLLLSQTPAILAYLGPRLGLVPDGDPNGAWRVHALALTALDGLSNEVHNCHHPIASGREFLEFSSSFSFTLFPVSFSCPHLISPHCSFPIHFTRRFVPNRECSFFPSSLVFAFTHQSDIEIRPVCYWFIDRWLTDWLAHYRFV